MADQDGEATGTQDPADDTQQVDDVERQSDQTDGEEAGQPESGEVVLMTHDSFEISDAVFEAFTSETGLKVTHLTGGDAGELVARAALVAPKPEADVLFGIGQHLLAARFGRRHLHPI